MLNVREILIAMSLKYHGDWEKIYDSIVNKKDRFDDEDKKKIEQLPCHALTLMDDLYPKELKESYRPPFVLFYYGDISLLKRTDDCVAVIGSREASEYGKQATEKIVREIADKKIIVSGLAKGIDSVAHREAIKNKGKTIAILGSGIDYCYPSTNQDLYKEIKEHHLLISEYPGSTPPSPHMFPLRNRLIAAIGKAVVVTEAYEHSGTSITVMHALQLGRDVMCVPYELDKHSECNRLIKSGAYLVESGNDVLEIIK